VGGAGAGAAATTAANQAAAAASSAGTTTTASAGGSGGGSPAPPSPPVTTAPAGPSGGSSGAGNVAVQAAESQLGVPYVYGGESPGSGFDCSGLTQWSWAQAGVGIPRTAAGQYSAVPHVSLSTLEPGDLLFYYNLDGTGTVDHVVMYVGSGPYGSQTIIQAPYTGATVSYAMLYTYGLVGAGRP
ncbi:MAG: C40 family peptidase, partial [Acidimicrobiales bacterium]